MRKVGVILGVGIVDVDYRTQIFENVNGVRKLVWICPFYEKWKQMIRRCYSDKEKLRNTNYKDVTCCPEWLSLSNFKTWMESQNYLDSDGKILELDKDFLVEGNKIYSPSTCVFVHHKVNSFIFTEDFYVKTYLLGVTYVGRSNKFQAQCNDPLGRYSRNLGVFSNEIEAHDVYMRTKCRYACDLADSIYVNDERVAVALRNRFKQTS